MKYLQINKHGEILSYAEPVEGFLYTPSENDILYDGDIDLATNYYNSETNSIETRSKKPGEYYKWKNNSWIFSTDKFEYALRLKRSVELSSSDWTQIPDSPLTTEQRTAWATYRQALRDLPDNLTGEERTIEEIQWPIPPTT